MKPFLKWVGGKYKIIDKIKTFLPKGKRLIEPFVGSGAVFLNTNYPKYTLADNNKDLIKLFKILKREKQTFIKYCAKFFEHKYNTEEMYLEKRELFNTTNNLRLKAALFLYLNKHAFNGLMRFNSKGKFNVPFGRYTKPYFPKNEMINFTNKLHKARIQHQDFMRTMSQAQHGDVVYCDPPYVPLSRTSNFTMYNANGFHKDEQQKLVTKANDLANRNITVIISNHDTEFVQQAYKNADKIDYFNVQRYISCQGHNRKKAKEILAIFE